MKFICLYCNHQENFLDTEPKKWVVKRYVVTGEYTHKCEKCGAAMAPISFAVRNKCLIIDEHVMYCFSNCINAQFCVLHNQYAPDCEVTGIKTKCLHGLYQQINYLSGRLKNIEKYYLLKDKLVPLKKVNKESDKEFH